MDALFGSKPQTLDTVHVLREPLSFFVLANHLAPANVACISGFNLFAACGLSLRFPEVVAYFEAMTRELEAAKDLEYLIFPTIDHYCYRCKPSLSHAAACPCLGCAIIATQRKLDFNHDLRKERGTPSCLSSLTSTPTANSAAPRSRRQPGTR